MGVNIDKHIIHLGPSADIKLPATADLYYTNQDLGHIEDSGIKEYCRNKCTCRRKVLLKDFDDPDAFEQGLNMCSCCDVCELNCKCSLFP